MIDAKFANLLRLWPLLYAMLFFQNIATPVHGRQHGGGKASRSVAGNAGIDRRFWAPNRIGTYLANDGIIVDYRPNARAGMEWPVGSGKTVIFAAGIWLAGRKDNEVVTAASEYLSEFQPGNVTGWAPGRAGVPRDPTDERFRVYIIDRKDTVSRAEHPDYADWPVADGAPFGKDGKPLLMGTSTAWMVFNDFAQEPHDQLFRSKPMGVEVQMTAWAHDYQNALSWGIIMRARTRTRTRTRNRNRNRNRRTLIASVLLAIVLVLNWWRMAGFTAD